MCKDAIRQFNIKYVHCNYVPKPQTHVGCVMNKKTIHVCNQIAVLNLKFYRLLVTTTYYYIL